MPERLVSQNFKPKDTKMFQWMKCLIATSCLLTASLAHAEQPTYTGLEKSAKIRGPDIKVADLKGKVVFFEYWGINCPPCRSSMPHLEELYQKYSPEGSFVIIGSHCQGRDDDAINKFLDSVKVTFPIYQNVDVAEAPCPGGIPFAALFDHTGKLVKSGYPSELYALVPGLVKACPIGHPILRTFKPKLVKDLAAKLKPGTNLELVIKDLEAKKALGGDAGDEAGEILALTLTWIEDRKQGIKDLTASQPSAASASILTYKKECPSDYQFDTTLDAIKTCPALSLFKNTEKSIEAQEKIFSRDLARNKKPKLSKEASDTFSKIKTKLLAVDSSALPGVKVEAAALVARIDKLLDA
jgi:thiol-disulfide isomerase/thioredoxin